MSEEANVPQENGELRKIEQEITQANPKVFKGIPAHQKREILRIISTTHATITSHAGPLPLPEHLEKYNSIIPDGANRIMKMAEKQQEHRIELENKAITSQLSQSKLGQIFGLIIGLAALACGTICILQGQGWPGAVIGGGGITGLVSVFVIGKRRQAKSLDQKN